MKTRATAINRFIPEIKAQGVAAIIVLIHEGANYRGAANDPSYQCDGLRGPMVDMMPKLDPAVTMVISGHTHQAYTCKIGGRLLVQARSYGAYFTETTLTIDTKQNRVIDAKAVNHLIDQEKMTTDTDAQKKLSQSRGGTYQSRPSTPRCSIECPAEPTVPSQNMGFYAG